MPENTGGVLKDALIYNADKFLGIFLCSRLVPTQRVGTRQLPGSRCNENN
ncbi:MAG: hypothetical protein Q7T96_18225 [Methylobacter sp.]|nr:hypothetical protein [Methylobacter sp.]